MENPSSVSLMGVAASGKTPSTVFAGSCGAPSDNNDKQTTQEPSQQAIALTVGQWQRKLR